MRSSHKNGRCGKFIIDRTMIGTVLTHLVRAKEKNIIDACSDMRILNYEGF